MKATLHTPVVPYFPSTAIAVMIAFGLWSSLLGPVASEMHMKADRIESDAKRLSDGADLAVRLGAVACQLPGPPLCM